MAEFKMTFGADPEFMVTEKDTAGKEQVVMACGKFGGKKGEPIMLTPDGGYLEDGVTVEFNVSPSPTLIATRDKVMTMIGLFKEKNPGIGIGNYTSFNWPLRALRKFPSAMEIGCAPDIFAYGLRDAPSIAKLGGLRCCGGHIHFGLDPWPDGLDKSMVVAMFDLVIGIPFFYKGMSDAHRYKPYGHLGIYRETRYGIEYRTPDNTWCRPDSRSDIKTLLKNADNVFKMFNNLLNKDGHGINATRIIETRARLNENLLVNPQNGARHIGLRGNEEYLYLQDAFKDEMKLAAPARPKSPFKRVRMAGLGAALENGVQVRRA